MFARTNYLQIALLQNIKSCLVKHAATMHDVANESHLNSSSPSSKYFPSKLKTSNGSFDSHT